MITLQNASAGYTTPAGPVVAVDGIDLEIGKNQIVGIAGESGCGKSTLLKLIYGQLGQGLKLFSGNANWHVKPGESATDENTIGIGSVSNLWWDKITYIPQAVNTLNPILRIEDQLIDSVPNRVRKSGKSVIRAEFIQLLEKLGLDASVMKMFPFQLSGGMMQRVLIGLAAFPKPDLILADEPTTALDVVVQKRILILLHRVQRELGNALVLVSHDLGVHYQISDRLVICYAGKIVEDGPTRSTFETPRHPYTRALIDSLPRVNDTTKRVGLDGRPPSLLTPPTGCRFAARCSLATEQCRREEPLMQTVGETRVACHFPLGGFNG